MGSKLNLIVLAVAVLALGVAAWALTEAQSAPPAAPGPDSNSSVYDAVNGLETRMAALEAAVIRERENHDPRVLEQLDDFDRRLKALAEAGGEKTLPPAAAVPPDEKGGKAAAAGEPDDEEVERFRKLRAAAARKERLKYAYDRIDGALKGLQITLTDEQRTKLATALTDFEPRRNEIWGEAKRSGAAAGPDVDWGVIIQDTTRLIAREFTERISPFIPGGDAERISANLNSEGK